MKNSTVRERLQRITSKVKRPWGEVTRSQPKQPVTGTGDTAGKKAEPPKPKPQPRDGGHR
jgi:hypothetical protein